MPTLHEVQITLH